MTCAAGLIVLSDPLALHDPGFLLSFGATFALVMLGLRWQLGPAARTRHSRVVRVLRASAMVVIATTAVEIVLLPIGARWFSLVTGVGLVANLGALPAMALVQAAGMTCVALWWVGLPALAGLAGAMAHGGVWVLIRSGDLVEWMPTLVREVPAPSLTVVLGYFAALAVALVASWPGSAVERSGRPGEPSRPRRRFSTVQAKRVAAVIAMGCAAALLGLIIHGGPERSAPAPWTWGLDTRIQTTTWPRDQWLLVTFLDVAQGDATAVRFPNGRAWLVDAGGTVAETTFDIGARVTAPALWALGHRYLSRVVLTHGHADHGGGLPAVMERFRPRELLVGIPVPDDPVDARVLEQARAVGTALRQVRTGQRFIEGPVVVRVLHPPPADWTRVKVRNDDSVVLWLRYGDVAILLPGDTGRDVEALWTSREVAAPLTVIKAGHHGSATSTAPSLLRQWPPVGVVMSAGRGNRFGHPHPDVLGRVAASGARVWRTDQDGAVQMATNGKVLVVRTAAGQVDVIRPARSPPA